MLLCPDMLRLLLAVVVQRNQGLIKARVVLNPLAMWRPCESSSARGAQWTRKTIVLGRHFNPKNSRESAGASNLHPTGQVTGSSVRYGHGYIIRGGTMSLFDLIRTTIFFANMAFSSKTVDLRLKVPVFSLLIVFLA